MPVQMENFSLINYLILILSSLDLHITPVLSESEMVSPSLFGMIV